VAVFAPLPQPFTYAWPDAMGKPEAGLRVRVPFGRGHRTGVILGEAAVSPEIQVKEVSECLDGAPLYDGRRRAWLERLRQYYLAAPGEVWELALGWAEALDGQRFRCPDRETLAAAHPLLATGFTTRAAVSLKTLRRRLGQLPFRGMLERAMVDGLIEAVDPNPSAMTENFAAGEARPEALTSAQQRNLMTIDEAAGAFVPFLLFGCTGSGKTEVYLRAIERIVADGGQALILVPEIGLTPMWLARLAARFAQVAVWHSGLGGPERLRNVQTLPDCQVLIGTRSALFLPLPRLRLIVVDEEHDGSFKQQEGVGYSARDMAVLLAQELDIPVVLGSATPSLESWRQAVDGHYRLLELPERIQPHAEPVPEVIDLRGVDGVLSDLMLAALREVKAAGQQAILYLNRRGYAPALQCTACGEVESCPHCSLRLTLHRRRRQLRCHACGFVVAVPRVCAHCGEAALIPLGAGTEKLEEALQAVLPALQFVRFDRDTVTSPKRLSETLSRFAHGDIDCLIGTQMLVKGHHFPNVALVGVINADLGTALPDFRAGERWWQQMTQVIGRTGRGETPGRVIIQTLNPDAPWLSRLGEHRARAVLDQELALRRQLHYPPFSRWARVLFSAVHANAAEEAAEALAGLLRRGLPEIAVTGPMPCAIERLGGRFRFELILRDDGRRHLPWRLAPLLMHLPVPSGVRRHIDVDPQDMM
jgi:primosomal protein N' (replication factor Y) (superfamily II helicase)